MRRTLIIFFEILASLTGLAFLLFALLLWRLLTGPLSTERLTPFIAHELSRPEAGITTHISESVLQWDRASGTLTLRLLNVNARNRDGRLVAALPALDVKCDLRALAELRTGSVSFVAQHPLLNLERTRDGQITLYGEILPPAPPISPAAARDGGNFILNVISNIDRIWRFSRLAEIHLTAGTAVISGGDSRAPWTFSLKQLILRKDDRHQLSGYGEMQANIGGSPLAVTASLLYNSQQHMGAFDWEIHDFNPSSFSLPPGGAAAPIANIPFDAKFHMAFGATLPDTKIDLQLASNSPGTLTAADFFPAAVAIKSAALEGSATIHDRDLSAVLSIDKIGIDFGGKAHLDLKAHIETGNGAATAEIGGEARGLTAEDLRLYWPIIAARGARQWVLENIKAGAIPLTSFAVNLHSPLSDLRETKVDSMQIESDIDHVAVTYMRTMPQAQDIAGHIRADLKGMDVRIDRAHIGQLQVTPSQLRIGDFDKKDQSLAMTINMSSPIEEILRIIDYPPLGYTRAIGLRPADVGGQVNAALHIAFPLLANLSLKDVDINGAGHLIEGTNNTLVPNLDVAGAQLDFSFDKRHLQLAGMLRLNTVPAQMKWAEYFSGPLLSEGTIALTMNEIQGQHFGLDFGSVWQGVAQANIGYKRFGGGDPRSSLAITGDLSRVKLDSGRLGWRKDSNQPAQISVQADVRHGQDIDLSKIAFSAPGASVAASATLDSTNFQIKTAHSDSFLLGGSNMKFDLARRGEGWEGHVWGQSLDLSGSSDSTAGSPPLNLQIDLDRIMFAPDRALSGVKASLRRNSEGWQSIDMRAADASSGTALGIRMTTDTATGARIFSMRTDNLGNILKAVNWTDAVDGGAFVMEGKTDSNNPAPEEPIKGDIEMGPYKVHKEVPIVLRLLNLLLVEGIGDFITGDQISFSRLRGSFALKGDSLDFSDVRTAGGTLGLTMDGTVDLAQDQVRLSGTVVPAYTLNHIIGNIPLIGDLLTGGSGGGIFAATYTVRGPFDDFAVKINGASILAPGPLRNLFFLEGTGSDSPNTLPSQ